MPEEQTNVARQRIGKHLAGQRGLGLLRDQKWHQFPECGWRLRVTQHTHAPTVETQTLSCSCTTPSQQPASPGRGRVGRKWVQADWKSKQKSGKNDPLLGFLRAILLRI